MSDWRLISLIIALVVAVSAPEANGQDQYRLNPGDMLDISIWNDPNMKRTVLVLPDGRISYPLAGHMQAAGLTPMQLEAEIKYRLVEQEYYRDPALTVTVMEAEGNKVFVLGEVASPGDYIATRPLTVMQLLAMAGGMSQFADQNDVSILRTLDDGSQERLPFDYSKVLAGRDLSTNIRLRNGDVVIVPPETLF